MSNESKLHPYEGLIPDRIIDAVEAQGFTSDARILALNSYENRVYQVGVEDGSPLIAKFYRPERWSDEQILEEHNFTLELAALDIPVVAPLQIASNPNDETSITTLFNFAGFKFALYPRQGGHSPELDQLDNLVILGRFLGRIHAGGKQDVFQHRPSIDIQSYGIDSVRFLNGESTGEPFIPAELLDAYNSLSRDLLERIRTRFTATPYREIKLHGDCHPSNILWRDEHAHFVDFDDARNGPAIQDLWMLISGDRDQQSLQMSTILEGYRQFYDFDLAELSLIESLRTLRIMHYAAWLARRWDDPAFPMNFPWFNTQRYWSDHILELREQLAAIDEPPLQIIF
ncbi:serine/threonine protein kinase [Aurantivibrio infirmus]